LIGHGSAGDLRRTLKDVLIQIFNVTPTGGSFNLRIPVVFTEDIWELHPVVVVRSEVEDDLLGGLCGGGVILLKYLLECRHFVRPDGWDGVTEDAAKPPVGERLEGPAEALGVGGAAPAGLLDGAVNTEALQAEPGTGDRGQPEQLQHDETDK